MTASAVASDGPAAVARGTVVMRGDSTESDADLLAYMAMRAEDPATAREAWAEFYRRHAGYLQAICERAYGAGLGGDLGAGDLVAETFRRAFDRAHQFAVRGAPSEDVLRRQVRAWLGRIAQRLFQDAMRSRRRLEQVHVEAEDWERIPFPAPGPAPDPGKLALVRRALQQLSDREQCVLRVTFQWYQPGQPHQRLPDDVIEDLAEALQTTPENLRQIRRRALERIRAFVARPRHVRETDEALQEDDP